MSNDPIVEVPEMSTSPVISPVVVTSSPLSTADEIFETFRSSQKFFHTLQGWTILFSLIVLTILFIFTIGFIFCCCLKRFKKVKNKLYDGANSGGEQQIVIGSSALFNGSENYAKGAGGSGSVNSGGSTGNKRMLMPHKNIITPDKNLPFVVPMISLQQTQIQGPSRAGPSASSSFYGPAVTQIPPMLEEQYFPQYHLEDTTAPQVGFAISYQVSTQILRVRVLGGNNFPCETEGASHSVHVKVYPGRGNKQRTKDFPGSSPIYNQEFSFHVRKDTLRTKVLKLRVIGQNFSINNATGQNASSGSTSGGSGSIRRNFTGSSLASSGSTVSTGSAISAGKTLVGVINLALKDMPAVNYEDIAHDFKSGHIWKILEHPSSYGEGIKLEVSLKWSEEPSPGLFIMKIKEAYGLHEITEAEYTTTYVKVTLQEQGRSIKNRKTRLIRWGSQPNYDDTFVVTIPYELLSQISFTLSLIARGRLGSKVILGKINVGPVPYINPQSGFAAGSEIWEDMCHQKNIEVSRWLPLMMP